MKEINRFLYAISALIILCFSTICCFLPVFFIGLLKLLPIQRLKILSTCWVDRIAALWCSINNGFINLKLKNTINVTAIPPLCRNNSYLVIANHQSACDIVLLQWLFHRKIPVFKFFIKDQLKWIPLLNYCWWAMGFPFIKRYSKDKLTQIEKNHYKKVHNQSSMQKSMAIFRHMPATIANFVEGTRFTQEKHHQQQSEFQYLLKPKAGGISYAIQAMDKKLRKILDVTIIYSTEKPPRLWDFLCHRIENITLHVREIMIPAQFLQDDWPHEDQQAHFRAWLNEQWAIKDQMIARYKGKRYDTYTNHY